MDTSENKDLQFRLAALPQKGAPTKGPGWFENAEGVPRLDYKPTLTVRLAKPPLPRTWWERIDTLPLP